MGFAEPRPGNAVRFDPLLDASIIAGSTALWIGSELAKSTLKPSACRWCAVGPFDFIDGPAQRGLEWSNADLPTADTLASVLAFGALPVATLASNLALTGVASSSQRLEFAENVSIVAEAAMLALDLNQAVKFLSGRERPFVHRLPASEKNLTAHPDDNNLSFFSGHTTEAFAIATALGTVANLRGYREARWIWGGGLAVATSVGYLRIAGGRHYFSDVVSGALVGSLVGISVPLLFHARTDTALALTASRNLLVLQGVW